MSDADRFDAIGRWILVLCVLFILSWTWLWGLSAKVDRLERVLDRIEQLEAKQRREAEQP